MNADEARREEIARAAQRLEGFLQTLSPEEMARQSACAGWTVADVVGHLVERGGPIPDQIERGLSGDISPTPGVSTAPPASEDQFRVDLDHSAVALRQELGDGLLPEFARLNRDFDRVLSLIKPDDWDKLCYHRLHPETVRSKVDIRIAELAMHEWDIHWAFDRNAVLAEDSLPGLVSASGRAVRRAFRPDQARILPVRYRFQISGPEMSAVDLTLAASGGGFELNPPRFPGREPGPQPDVVFRCSAATYAMVIFGRRKLSSAIDNGLVTADGDAGLINAFIDSFVGG